MTEAVSFSTKSQSTPPATAFRFGPDEPLVSIIVSNYNYGKYLRTCLDALTAQTYRNIEIVGVDAFSADESRAIFEEYASKDVRIKLVFCPRYEKYPSVTYNMGFLHSKGEFIAIADPDDISLSHRIEQQVRYLLAHPEIDVCGTNCREFNDDQDVLVVTTVERNVQNAAPPVRNPSLMLRKACLAKHGLWDWRCEMAADFEWLYRFYCGGAKFHILEECCLMYRHAYGTNVSSTRSLNQTLKLALFRTYFGVQLFRSVGFRWWRMTFITYLYASKLLAIWLRSQIYNRFRLTQ
jgi:glycosyltransferase involved in cell wall biosynthesis